MKKKSIFFLMLFSCFLLNAQKTIAHVNENWLHAHLNIRVHQKIGIALDAGYRFRNFFEGTTQTLIRLGGVFYFNENNYLHLGIAYFNSLPLLNNGQSLIIPEIRPYQRLFMNSKRGKFNISQRYRLEERFFRNTENGQLLSSYRYNYRFGYQLNVQFPFRGNSIEPKKLFLVVYDEVFVNFGKQIIYNYFDQNRIYIGLGYQISKPATITAGYQNIWQQTSSGNKFTVRDCVRVAFSYNLDFRKEN